MGVPTFKDKLPDMEPKALIRRDMRARRLVMVEKIAMPAQSLLHLRAVQVGLAKDFKSAGSVSERVAIAGALCKVVDARRVLLRIPAPARENTRGREGALVPVEAHVVDVEPEMERGSD